MWSLDLNLGPAASQAFVFHPFSAWLQEAENLLVESLARQTPAESDPLNLRVPG